MINLSRRDLVTLGVVALLMVALGFAIGTAVTPTEQLPQKCTAGQILRWDGGAWTCATAVKIKAGREYFDDKLVAESEFISDILVVKFGNDEPFSQAPTVIVSLAHIDSRDVRITVYATNVTKDGFTINRGTWDYTRLEYTAVSWIAFGV